MSSNFFVDFTLFNFLGVMAGADWMIAFSAATFLALLTRKFHGYVAYRQMRAQIRSDKPNYRALPAFRNGTNWRDRNNRDH